MIYSALKFILINFKFFFKFSFNIRFAQDHYYSEMTKMTNFSFLMAWIQTRVLNFVCDTESSWLLENRFAVLQIHIYVAH